MTHEFRCELEKSLRASIEVSKRTGKDYAPLLITLKRIEEEKPPKQ